MQALIQRAILDAERSISLLGDPGHDRIAVQFVARQSLEYEHVERAAQQLGRRRWRHALLITLDTVAICTVVSARSRPRG
jgi:hypothetical protein